MKLTIEQDNQSEIASFLSQKIIAFNHQHWQITDKQPLALTYRDDQNTIIAGVSGVTFGNWLHLERLWVDEPYRKHGLGAKLLQQIEQQAKQLGCTQVLVDTLEFQAKPFYLKYGYNVEFEQHNYPLTGKRTYLTKAL